MGHREPLTVSKEEVTLIRTKAYPSHSHPLILSFSFPLSLVFPLTGNDVVYERIMPRFILSKNFGNSALSLSFGKQGRWNLADEIAKKENPEDKCWRRRWGRTGTPKREAEKEKMGKISKTVYE